MHLLTFRPLDAIKTIKSETYALIKYIKVKIKVLNDSLSLLLKEQFTQK